MKNKGSAFILALVVTQIIFLIITASLHLSNYQMLITSVFSRNINGYSLAEGGVFTAKSLLNEILFENKFSVSEKIFDEINEISDLSTIIINESTPGIHTGVFNSKTVGGEKDMLFKNRFKELIDAEMLKTLDYMYGWGNAYKINYNFILNDMYDAEYEITAEMKYSNGGFDIVSKAVNLATGISDTAIGRIVFKFDAGEELIELVYENGSYIIKAMTIENTCNFRYELISLKKQFE